jgi:hypothetical protein
MERRDGQSGAPSGDAPLRPGFLATQTGKEARDTDGKRRRKNEPVPIIMCDRWVNI